MTVYHRHHRIPRHIGGTDDVSNIEILTVAEHAEAHRILYESDHRWQDYLAWKALSGQIGIEEICREKSRLPNIGNKRRIGKKHNSVSKHKMSVAKFGKHRSEKSRQKQSKTVSGNGNHFFGKHHTKEMLQHLSDVKKEMYKGGGNPRAIKVIITDTDGTYQFDCIKDYAVLRGIKPITVQNMYRSLQKDPNYRPKQGHVTEKILSIKKVI